MAYPISDVTRRVVYSGSAGVGPYSFSFEVLANTDIAVYKNTTLLTLTTNYTVTINANGTGSVTLVVAATGSDTITLVGDRSIERATDFVTGGDLFANSLNDEFDSLVIFAQQVKEEAGRGLKAPITDPTDVNMTLPIKSSRKGKVLAFDETTGDPVNGPALDAMTTVIAQSANINTVAANIASVNANATNIVAIQNASANATSAAASAVSAAASASSAEWRTTSTGAAKIPAGTTAQRDGSPATGYFRFNSTTVKFEGYNGTAWGSVGGGATGGGSDDVFIENSQTVTSNYTLTAGKNAGTFGPITINSGVDVTVPSGAVWTIV